MNREHKRTRQSSAQSDAFVEQALARISELRALTDDVTEALGLPAEYRYAVLSSLAPMLLEDYLEREQREAASRSSSHKGNNAPQEEL